MSLISKAFAPDGIFSMDDSRLFELVK